MPDVLHGYKGLLNIKINPGAQRSNCFNKLNQNALVFECFNCRLQKFLVRNANHQEANLSKEVKRRSKLREPTSEALSLLIDFISGLPGGGMRGVYYNYHDYHY